MLSSLPRNNNSIAVVLGAVWGIENSLPQRQGPVLFFIFCSEILFGLHILVLAILCSVRDCEAGDVRWELVAVVVKGDIVTSKAIFTGIDNSDPKAEGAEIFRNSRNHVKAIASVLKFSADENNFKPKEHGVKETSEAYRGFNTKVNTFPGLTLKERNDEPLRFTGDREQFKEEVTAYYKSLAGKSNVAAAAFVDQIPKSSDGGPLGTRELVLVSIYSDERNTVVLDISTINVRLSERDGAIEVDPQNTVLDQIILSVNQNVLVANAETLASKLPSIDVKTLLDELSTNDSSSNELDPRA
ncbi:hypothetical protein BGZ65_006861 [Modicella reniformis]|uniref:Uncharacterized protein n=1 Tax=Modicella reniformis TaxID=1440133 RepID=A0A9P6LT34_9FUNG|nr:hypothetical protein BGZ65_006861 [Modicella reniformis]